MKLSTCNKIKIMDLSKSFYKKKIIKKKKYNFEIKVP
jgi:hypothetical protein